jgi:plastocyanin
LRSRALAVTAAGFVLVVATACGPGGGSPGPTAPGQNPGPTSAITPSGQAAAESCTVGPIEGAQESHITGNHDLAPTDFTVPVGGSITWFNDSTLGHTITFADGPDCDYVLVNGAVSVTFNTPGVFTYLCRIYPRYMFGTVIVQ